MYAYHSILFRVEMTQRESELVQVKAATSMVFATSIIGAILMWCVFFAESKGAWLTIIGAGCALLFLATPGINIGAMNAVPVQNRAFCMAMMSVCIHALGDVPSPILAGLIKDDLAPGCNGVDAASAPCREDAEGLRQTMLIVCSWFLWCILLAAYSSHTTPHHNHRAPTTTNHFSCFSSKPRNFLPNKTCKQEAA